MRKSRLLGGLICYAFYSASSNLITMLAVMLSVGFIMLTGNYSGINAFLHYGIFLYASSLLMSTSKDAYSKWNKFQLAMPVKRRDVIASKYIGHLILLFSATVITVIFLLLFMILQKDIFERRIVELACVSIGASLLECSLFYPLLYMAGENKEEGLLVVCLLFGFVASIMLWRMVRLLNCSEYINGALCILIPMALFFVSYMVTAKIYAVKDV